MIFTTSERESQEVGLKITACDKQVAEFRQIMIDIRDLLQMIFTFVGWRYQGQRQRCKVQEMQAEKDENFSVICGNFHLEPDHFEIDLVQEQRTFPFLPAILICFSRACLSQNCWAIKM